MNERRSLTPRERRDFEEIQARLAAEMPDVAPEQAARARWKWRLAIVAVPVGLVLLVAGLVVVVVVLAFIGFVVLVFAIGWITARLQNGGWGDWARSMVPPIPPHDDGAGPPS